MILYTGLRGISSIEKPLEQIYTEKEFVSQEYSGKLIHCRQQMSLAKKGLVFKDRSLNGEDEIVTEIGCECPDSYCAFPIPYEWH